MLFSHIFNINESDHIKVMELLYFLLDGHQSSVTEHLQALAYTILSENDMVNEVSDSIY